MWYWFVNGNKIGFSIYIEENQKDENWKLMLQGII